MAEKFTKTVTCVICPVGCSISVECENDADKINVLSVSGNRCERGYVYASHEVACPERILTTTVRGKYNDDDRLYRVPVKSRTPVPKDKMLTILRTLKDLTDKTPVSLPAAMGDVVLPDAEGTGIDIIVTRSV